MLGEVAWQVGGRRGDKDLRLIHPLLIRDKRMCQSHYFCHLAWEFDEAHVENTWFSASGLSSERRPVRGATLHRYNDFLAQRQPTSLSHYYCYSRALSLESGIACP